MVRPARLNLALVPKPKIDLAMFGRPERAKGDAAAAGFTADYAVAEALGSGTTAVVKRAVRRADGCQVAVKCVRSSDEEVQSFVRQEYDLLRSLKHDAIVRADALHECGNRLFMVMELCEDGDLSSYVRRLGHLSEDHSIALFRQLLGAVSHLHQKRVVHRDLKPSNLMLRQGGEVLKVTDFNSAKVVGTSSGGGVMLTERGTRAYLAPEVLLGRNWNERVDIWASGLCLYFMLCGERPFDSESPTVKEKFAAGALPKLAWLDNGPSQEVRALARQCLSVDMHERPPAMKVLVDPLLAMKEPADAERRRRRSTLDAISEKRGRCAAAVRDDLAEKYGAVSSPPGSSRSRTRSMPRLFELVGAHEAECSSPAQKVSAPLRSPAVCA